MATPEHRKLSWPLVWGIRTVFGLGLFFQRGLETIEQGRDLKQGYITYYWALGAHFKQTVAGGRPEAPAHHL